MGLEFGELLIERCKQFSQIGCRAGNSRVPGGQPAQGRGNLNRNGHQASTVSGTSFSEAPSVLSIYFSNSAILGAMGSSSSYLPASTSVVFKPLPVMHSTVVSSGEIRPWA